MFPGIFGPADSIFEVRLKIRGPSFNLSHVEVQKIFAEISFDVLTAPNAPDPKSEFKNGISGSENTKEHGSMTI